MSSIGLPALNGFVGEFTILVGAFNRNWSGRSSRALGIVLGAAYMLWLYQRVFFGPLDNPENQEPAGPEPPRALYLVPLVLLCFWIGLYPRPFFEILEKPVEYVVQRVDPSLVPEAAVAAAEAEPAPAAVAGVGE